MIGREQALQVALAAEQAGLAYYQSILESTRDPEIRVLAQEFVDEETMHVRELQRWISACSRKSGNPCIRVGRLRSEPRSLRRRHRSAVSRPQGCYSLPLTVQFLPHSRPPGFQRTGCTRNVTN